jgi:hypothetical protein
MGSGKGSPDPLERAAGKGKAAVGGSWGSSPTGSPAGTKRHSRVLLAASDLLTVFEGDEPSPLPSPKFFPGEGEGEGGGGAAEKQARDEKEEGQSEEEEQEGGEGEDPGLSPALKPSQSEAQAQEGQQGRPRLLGPRVAVAVKVAHRAPEDASDPGTTLKRSLSEGRITPPLDVPAIAAAIGTTVIGSVRSNRRATPAFMLPPSSELTASLHQRRQSLASMQQLAVDFVPDFQQPAVAAALQIAASRRAAGKAGGEGGGAEDGGGPGEEAGAAAAAGMPGPAAGAPAAAWRGTTRAARAEDVSTNVPSTPASLTDAAGVSNTPPQSPGTLAAKLAAMRSLVEHLEEERGTAAARHAESAAALARIDATNAALTGQLDRLLGLQQEKERELREVNARLAAVAMDVEADE